ncbi:neutral zinc metallopeptidase [Nonomuraea turcica]|uniref:neutral zinc metallopeptidase n=1 Tax=Nonomuraea sp. G32 TaxID=3067274 RepID=UPI00273BD9F0|nr:neutral zinc metallopeptidase [Nonomuraea sp. G32]MDP4507517.1 neutral zinc metallopeptidase [Nonomuraea sp. G32]
MKLLKSAALACVLTASIAVAAPTAAAAYPVKDPKLTKNSLYDMGALPMTTCEEPPIKRNNRKLARAYLNAVIACLEDTWEQHLWNAGMRYEKVKVRHMDRIPKNYCGFDVGKEDSQAWYCGRNGTLVFQLGKGWLDDPYDLWLFDTAASMYGYHVQKQVGIATAIDKLRHGKKAEYYEQERRESLQTECLGGAFIKSVWPIGNRTTDDWDELLDLFVGDEPGDERWYGKASTIKMWIKRGFATGDPGACNTWTAPSSEVA